MLKNTSIIALIFLLLAPPMQAHRDVLVDDSVAHVHKDVSESDENHHKKHHKNESEDEQNSDHHHDCVNNNFSPTFIFSDYFCGFIEIVQIKKTVLFYQNLHTSTYLNCFFQPPKIH